MTTNFPTGDPADAGSEVVAADAGFDGAAEPADTPARAWGYWELLYFMLFAVPGLFLLMILCTAAVMGVSNLQDWDLDLAAPRTQASLIVVVQLFWWALVLGYIYVVVTSKYNLPFASSIGWVSPSRAPTFYLAGGVILAFAVAGVSTFFPAPEGQLPIELLLQDEISILLMAVFGVLVAPVAEEVVFRGFFFPVFERKHGAVIAILVTSVPFSLLHGPQYGWRWQNLTLLLAVATVFGIVRTRTGSVLATTLIHVAYNATLFSALFAARDQIKEL